MRDATYDLDTQQRYRSRRRGQPIGWQGRFDSRLPKNL
jgi:hypothetical protein